ncbi:MAG: tol-pal system-associated acyl-CoA thioesterase [Pseudomonadota bacterium]
MSFTLPITVYYEDTDALGIVYNANYLKFFERARTDWLRHIGIEQSDLLKSQVGFAVVSANIRFKKAAKLDDQLVVSVTLKQLRRASLLFFQKVVFKDNERVAAEAEVKIGCISPQLMKPRPVPQDIRDQLIQFLDNASHEKINEND